MGPMTSSILEKYLQIQRTQYTLGLIVLTFLVCYVMGCGVTNFFFGDNQAKKNEKTRKIEE